MAEDNSVLIVRHLPTELPTEDKEELLRHFGATRVRCFSSGRMKHTAFATFQCHADAAAALGRLHQLEVLGSRLSVEFSNSQQRCHHPSMVEAVSSVPSNDSATLENKVEKDAKESAERKRITDQINSVNAKWGVEYAYNPRLQYMYPSPTVNILTNIANALASVPKFYVQVLHLMNKMNLPPPFGAVTATPPIPEGEPPPLPPLPVTSSEESELESDEETHKSVSITRKRPRSDSSKSRKKPKIHMLVPPVPSRTDLPSIPAPTPEEVFEQPQATAPKKIEFKLSLAIAESVDTNSTNTIQASLPNVNNSLPDNDGSNNHDICNDIRTAPELALEPKKDLMNVSDPEPQGGFGKLEPQKVTKMDSSSSSEEEPWGATEFITSRQLRRGRLSRSETRDLPLLKNYNRGEPTPRLYIKNLAKQTTEKDLHYIFGRHVNWEDELEKNMFDIRLMKEGRMKGQAFITLPNEELARESLDAAHTFLLHGKPMVVQFARSAKPKEVADGK